MIVVNSGIMQEKIKSLVLSIDSPKFSFLKKDGVKLCFSCDSDDETNAVAIIKKALKSDPIICGLLFSVKAE